MEELIAWLLRIEQVACETYESAAMYYANDSQLNNFLIKLAEEEAYHCELLENVGGALQSSQDIPSAFSIDRQTLTKIINPFLRINEGVNKKILTKEKLLAQIAEAEFSEWNSIFLYTIEALKNNISDYAGKAAKLQSHIQGIQLYLEQQAEYTEILTQVENIKPVWTENILVVDDDRNITLLIESLLKRTGSIDIAYDGLHATRMIDEKYYRLIISDIDMPEMDGISLYQSVLKKFPQSKNKFLFMTGNLSPEKQAFLDNSKLKYMTKPMRIKEIRKQAYEILANA